MNLYHTMQLLRDLADDAQSDILANAAARLASQLESVHTPFGYDLAGLTELDRQLIRFAHSRQPNKDI
jgi:hypothetical protein